MATKRTPIKRDLRQRITHEAVKAYLDEDDGELCRLLGLTPWKISPLDAVGPCVYSGGTGRAMSWPQAAALREELRKAAGDSD